MTPAEEHIRAALAAGPTPGPVKRLLRYAGQTMRTARNPCLTAREAIEVGNWLAELLAELDGERNRSQMYADLVRGVAVVLHGPGYSDTSKLPEEVARLRAEVEALRADGERLDYIASNARCDPKMDGQHVWWPTSFNHRLVGPNLRAAIDAAKGGE